MAKIEDLIAQVPDSRLRKHLAEEVQRLKVRTKFGLVFEEHIPEVLPVPSLPVAVGGFAAPHGSDTQRPWLVEHIDGTDVFCSRPSEVGVEADVFRHRDLVTVKRLGDVIYPALRSLGRVTRDAAKPYHVILEADNYHALQMLQYTHQRKIDLIYIDPPYNTGARDWRYNNNYVDSGDAWRHSKWLSFMKKRLILAKRLLAASGALICSIDDYEVHHLALLLEEIFPGWTLDVIVVEHHPQGAGSNTVSRTHEYALVCTRAGMGLPGRVNRAGEQRWGLRRAGQGENNWRRNRWRQFFAIHVEPGSYRVMGVGPPIARDDREYPTGPTPEGYHRVYPIDGEGNERVWRYARATMIANVSQGRIVSSPALSLSVSKDVVSATPVFSVWKGPRYNAGLHGSSLLTNIMGQANTFPYPKSLYTVTDLLRTVVGNRESSVILDFFGGSGTTLHAVALLNAEKHDARHQCILVTNNEVSEVTARALQRQGLKPGDDQWEQHGICRAVTFPRCKYAITGVRDNAPLTGTYLAPPGHALADGFSDNIEYLQLQFLDPNRVALGKAADAIFPILWLAAGGFGELAGYSYGMRYAVPSGSRFGVLFDERSFRQFAEEVVARCDICDIRIVFLVTESDDNFRDMAGALPPDIAKVQLYKSYLKNFQINTHWAP